MTRDEASSLNWAWVNPALVFRIVMIGFGSVCSTEVLVSLSNVVTHLCDFLAVSFAIAFSVVSVNAIHCFSVGFAK